MIKIQDNYFKIDTPNSTYLFKVNPIGTLENIYYGKRIEDAPVYKFLEEQNLYGAGVQDVSEDGQYQIYNDTASSEFSNRFRGDHREVFIELSSSNEDRECEFLFDHYELIHNFDIKELPTALNKEETLVIVLIDKFKKLEVKLYYSTYKDVDVITKSASITNNGETLIRLERFMSNQVDLVDKDYLVDTLTGAWAKERQIKTNPLGFGTLKIDSKYGLSSARTNPFFVLKEKNTTVTNGECYGFNLIYSGNHAAYLVRNSYNKVRVMNGINDSTFSWNLHSGETFFSPEATICFSSKGTNGLTNNYHAFINENIVRGYYKNRVRPLLINTWEGVHKNFNEETIVEMAKAAKKFGIETFVLDDGWYGNKNENGTYVGDWFANLNKLPHGIEGLSKRIKEEVGMNFGLWFEPEMIATDSELIKTHPDWIIEHPQYKPLYAISRYVLDLTRDEVVDYLIETISKQIELAQLDYLKWDCNRDIVDAYSAHLENQGEFFHRYMIGFYRLIKTLTERYPHVLFESCAGGGNRVDMGILCYSPQFWCSDNTDSYDRMKIQEGTLYCYPQSCIGAHVSSSPNLQTGRKSFVDNRFNVACIGAFGYELDMRKLTLVDAKAVKEQIKWYKENRQLLQFGKFYKISSIFDSNHFQFSIVSKDQKEAIYFIGNDVQELYARPVYAKPLGLSRDYVYNFKTRQQYFDFTEGNSYFKEIKDTEKVYEYNDEDIDKVEPLKCEVQEYNVKGSTLEDSGVRLYYEWIGGNSNPKRIMFDFGTRIYKLTKI